MTQLGPTSGPYLRPRRRPCGRRSIVWVWAMGAIVATAAVTAAAQDDGASTLPVALQRIYSSGVPTSVDELRLMDEHQRTLVQRLLQVTVGLEIGPTQGSGVIISSDGYILTAAHVAGEANRNVWVMTSDGRRLRGKTLGMNKGMDAGLIKIDDAPREGEDPPPDAKNQWPHADMGSASELRPGSWCLALGHPGGYQLDRQPAARFGRVLSVTNSVIGRRYSQPHRQSFDQEPARAGTCLSRQLGAPGARRILGQLAGSDRSPDDRRIGRSQHRRAAHCPGVARLAGGIRRSPSR
jgi:hypothetical protein